MPSASPFHTWLEIFGQRYRYVVRLHLAHPCCFVEHSDLLRSLLTYVGQRRREILLHYEAICGSDDTPGTDQRILSVPAAEACHCVEEMDDWKVRAFTRNLPAYIEAVL